MNIGFASLGPQFAASGQSGESALQYIYSRFVTNLDLLSVVFLYNVNYDAGSAGRNHGELTESIISPSTTREYMTAIEENGSM